MFFSLKAFQPATLVLTAFVIITSCADGGPTETGSPRAEGERLAVAAEVVTDYKPVAGVIATRDEAEARARIGGTLTELSVDEGDQVRRGQRIARVSDQRLALETAALDAQAAALEAEALRASQDLERTRILVERGIYAPARLELDQAAADAARARLNAARAQRAAAAELAGQGAILAPADGQVTWAGVPAGSVVTAGQPIATIAAGEAIVRIDIPEGQANALSLGRPVEVMLNNSQSVTGRVVEIYPTVTAGQVRADIEVAGLDPVLIGQRVDVRVPLGERTAILIPADFISTRFGIDYVAVQAADGTASEVPVQLASGTGEGRREILSGIAAGDVIVAPEAP